MSKNGIFLIFLFHYVVSFDGGTDRKGYTLRTDQLDEVYRRAAIISLLKAKAKAELTQLPSTENVLYGECQSLARTPVELAKCVKRLLQQRERNRAQIVIQAQLDEQRSSFPLQPEENWVLSALKLAIMPIQNITVPAVKPKHVPTLSRPRDSIRHKRLLQIKLSRKFRHAKRLKFRDETLSLKRIRREIKMQPTSPRCKTPKNVKALRQVEKYFESANECIRYIKKLGLENSKFLSSILPMTFNNRNPGPDSAVKQLKEAVDQADSGLSILSPKILSLFPSKKGGGDEKLKLGSPTIFSFHDEGVMPLPRLLKLSGSNECETQEWIDLIMTMTGASHKLDQLLEQFQDHIKTLQEDVLPKIRRFEEQEALFNRINNSLSQEQRTRLSKFGYAQMNDVQLDLIYNEKGLNPPAKYFAKFKSDPNQDYFLEQTIFEMAELESTSNITEVFERHERHKRQAPKKDPNLLAPFAFSNLIFQPSFLGNLILSPHAFINDLMNPRFLGSDIISPRAFIASTLSPYAMVSRVLSPSAFRSQILTPQIVAEVIDLISPLLTSLERFRALEARVLSPEVLTVAVLSPSMGMVRVLSPGVLGVAVLSPTILQAAAASKGFLNVEVLSPGILTMDDGIG